MKHIETKIGYGFEIVMEDGQGYKTRIHQIGFDSKEAAIKAVEEAEEKYLTTSMQTLPKLSTKLENLKKEYDLAGSDPNQPITNNH